MPLYEYECTACHRHTEKIQKFSDPEITSCPHCGGALKRVISAPAFSLKGGGWYADGYGSAKPPAAAGEGGGKSDAPEAAATKDGGSSKEGGSSSDGASSTPAAPAPATAAPAAAPASASSDKK